MGDLLGAPRALMVHDYPPVTGGGVATAVQDLAALLGDEIDFTVVSSRVVDHFGDDRGLEGCGAPTGVRELAREIASADVVVAHWTFSCRRLATWALVLGRMLDVPTVCVVHTGPSHVAHNRFRALPGGAVVRALAPLVGRADAVVALSPSHAASLRRGGVPVSHVLPMPVRPMAPVTAAGPRLSPGFVVGVAGELSTLKGADHLPALVTALGSEVAFRVVGRGPLRARLSAVGVGVEDPVPPSRMGEFYDSVDCVLMLSGAESQCRVALEAMAAGVVVIARPVDGIVDLIEHGRTGLLTDPSPQSVRRAVEQVRAGGSAMDEIRRAAAAKARRLLDESTSGWAALLQDCAGATWAAYGGRRRGGWSLR